jgi:3-oxoacyl-[acyl-carrier protein] reductase
MGHPGDRSEEVSMASLSGRVALVTGATRGHGPAIARLLHARGAAVALHDAGDPAAAQALVLALDPAGEHAMALSADMADPLSVQKMVDETYRCFGRLDILVNALEAAHEGPLLAITPDEWLHVFTQNVHGAFFATQAAAKYMVLDRRGRIVNLSGMAGASPARAQTALAAAKGALNAMTRALAVELAPKQVTVNAVAPGAIETPDWPGRADERLAERVPLKRLGTSEDVAELVAFLASDEASYVTGEVYAVDGGLGGRR